MGTMIQQMHLSPADFGGEALEGCNENLNLTKPDAIRSIHAAYLEAGADIIETNTFGGTPLVLNEYDLSKRAYEINRTAAEIAAREAKKYSTDKKPRFVAGAMGPTTKAITVTGGVTFEDLIRHYEEQARGLFDGGVDYFLIETAQDTRNVKAALIAISHVFKHTDESIPIAVSCTIEATGTMLAGQSVEAFWASVQHIDPLYIGLNCATGPEFMTDHIRSLSSLAHTYVASVPNAGLPDEDGHYLETPSMMGKVLDRFLSEKWVNLIGGCCGTTAPHVAEFSRIAARHTPRTPAHRQFSFLSGIDFLELAPDNRPILVGERTNVVGSRKFKRLITSGDFEAAAEVARGQIKKGAQVMDVCLADPDRNELADIKLFLERAIRMVRVPLMIDSTDANVIAEALTYSQGKAIINSINLEDGEERFAKVIPLAKQFGTALVVGAIDDDPKQGMAITRKRKLEVAERSYDLLRNKYDIADEDIYWDALVFPAATGDAQYTGSAVETIEGVRFLKDRFPKCKTILGISNVSFGLPEAGREVLNSVFLYHCTLAGLDMAIVNTEQLRRYPSIPEEERTLAENLLWNRGTNPIDSFVSFYRTKKAVVTTRSELSLEERLARYIVDGTKEGLITDLDLARKQFSPLDIINGPLMKGMDEVGRLFNQNELIVAEVLQSAEAMKTAVAHLEKFMEKKEGSLRGKVLLATVKGDVHDIGKNLVEIILANNGFQVINLGIKVPPEQLIAAVKTHQPQIVGLSGLLVKSAQQMVTTAEDLTQAGISIPLLVGGAALSRTFTDRRIAKAYSGTVMYASDAMNGLELAKIVIDPVALEKFNEAKQKEKLETPDPIAKRPSLPTEKKRSQIVPLTKPPSPPDFDRHLLNKTPIDEIWHFINPRMLLGRHLGVPNSFIRLIEEKKESELNDSEQGRKAFEVAQVVEEVKALCRKEGLLAPKGVFQFFRATAKGETIRWLDSKERALGEWTFPRQTKEEFLCIADYLSNENDNSCLFVVTAGHGVRERAAELKRQGEYLRSHTLSALALETAEGYAEWLHSKIRGQWGIGDPPDRSMMELFKANYVGKRYSFGYPATPDLEGQKVIFDLLRPNEMGVSLTDGFMMDPEASVSAIVLHHPEAKYFSI